MSKSNKGYHAVPPPYTGNFIPFKPDLTFMDEIVESENMDVTTIVTPRKPQQKGVTMKKGVIESVAKAQDCKQMAILLIKPHNKTPYELIRGRTSLIDFMKPFGCPVTILNTRDHLGKFDGKAYEGFFIGKWTRLAFDVDSLTISMNYMPVVAENQTNGIAGTRDNIVTGHAEKKKEPEQEYIIIPICTTDPLISQDPKVSEEDAEEKPTEMDESEASDKDENDDQATRSEFERLLQQEKQTENPNSTNSINIVSTLVSIVGLSFTNDDPSSPVNAAEASNAFEEHLFERFSPFKNAFTLPPVLNVTPIDDTVIFGNAYDDEDVGAEAGLNRLETTLNVSPIPTTRIDKDHPKDQIIGDFNPAIQTRRMTKISDEHAMKVWTLVNLPNGKRAIGTKWVFINKKDERGVLVRNKARLVAQGYTQEEGIDYHEVFAPVAKIEAIRLFLAYASFMGFIVYQMDVKSAFLYGTIEEEVYVCQPPGFEDPQFPDKVYKVYVDDIIFGSTKKSLCDEFKGLIHKRFQISSMGELTFFLGLQVQQKKDGIFISQDKYVADILKKFDFATVKTASTPMEPNKALIKDEEADSVDVHLYRSMIGSLMYLTASRPDIMFVVCACARFQVTPKMSHLHAVKRIFRYLKGQPKLGLWYPRDSPFDLEAFSDSDYAGASLDRKSTTGGCQFLGKRLISWQCKKQTIVANSTTEAEYVVAANCMSDLYISFSRLVNLLEVKHFISTSVKEIDIVQLGIVSQAGLKLLLRSSSVSAPPHKVNSMDGLDSMLENVWVKLHGVPVTAFTEDGLSAIATNIDTPLMLDSYTSDMCIQSWGRSSYARALIEIRADLELKDTIVVAMPKLIGEGFYTCFAMIPQASYIYGFYVDVEEYELGDLNEPPNYKHLEVRRKRFDVEIKKIGFTQNPDESCVYLKASESNVAFLILYVDDILLMRNNVTMLREVKFGFLIALSQSAYLEKSLKKFRMENSKKRHTLMIEKPDYRKNTKDMVLVYGAKPEAELKVSCYADASFQTDKDDTKSQTGYVFVLNGGAVYWKSAKQSTTSMSSAEVKYIADAEASMEAAWIRKFIDGLGNVVPSNKRPMEMLCGNEPAITITNDPRILKGARHF
ncbi:putative ribonuclease H-like domain-containing protein [Tanacetum coccineum]